MPKPGKWRLERRESLTHKLTKEHKFRALNRLEQLGLICIVLFASFFGVAYGYYQNQYLPSLSNPSGPCIHNGIPCKDPFTPLWNGELSSVSGSPLANRGSITKDCSLVTTCALAIGGVVTGDTIIVMIGQDVTASLGTVTDSQANVYTTDLSDSASGALISHFNVRTTATAPGIDTVTHTIIGVTHDETLTIIDVSGTFLGIGSKTTSGQLSIPATGTDTQTLTVVNGGSMVVENFDINNGACAGGFTYPTGQTLIAYGCGGTDDFIDSLKSPVSAGQSQPSSWTVSFNSVGTGLGTYVALHDLLELKGPFQPQCTAQGYQCINTSIPFSGDLTLQANVTHQAIAMTKTPIDLSSVASKDILFWMTFKNQTNIIASKTYGWYLTINGTLPTQSGYTPFNDSSVQLMVLCYVPVNCYLYLNRSGHDSLLSTSGVGENPGIANCPQTSTLYICDQDAFAIVNDFMPFSVSLNYTASTTSVTTCQTNNAAGCSFLCAGGSPNVLIFCSDSSAASNSPCGAGGSACGTITLPWMNNLNKYYLAFFEPPGQTAQIQIGSNANGPFREKATSVYYWVPSPSTNTPAETAPTSFLGWLGTTIGGAFNAAAGFLAPVVSPLFSFGNSLLNAIISGMVQAINILIQAYRLVLNFVGTNLGLGNLGDLFISLMSIVVTLITTGFTTVVSFFTAIGSFLTSGWLGFLAGAAGAIPALISLALTIWNVVFNSNFNVKTILYADGLLLLWATYKKGLAGLFAWAALNVFIFTFVFNIAWTIFDIITRPIHRTKETVDPVG